MALNSRWCSPTTRSWWRSPKRPLPTNAPGLTSTDGTQRAVEVHVFPEAMRGTGEGHRPWVLAAVDKRIDRQQFDMIKRLFDAA